MEYQDDYRLGEEGHGENEMIFDEHDYAAAAEEDREAMLVQTDKRKGNSRYRNSMPIEDDQTT